MSDVRSMSMLLVTVGDRRVASSRIRGWRLADALTATGEVRVRAIVGPRHRSLLRLVLPRRFDVVLLQKWVPPLPVLRLLRRQARVLVYDCDDAIYLDVPQAESTEKAASTRARFVSLLSAIDGATVSTRPIAADIGARAPEVPVLVFAGPRPGLHEGEQQRSGAIWLGSPDTEAYLWAIAAELREVDQRVGFVAVGATERSRDRGLRVQPWSPVTERASLGEAAAGIFLQRHGEWERRKAGYKILEYIAAGVIPVAQRTAAAVEILGTAYPFYVEDGRWSDALCRATALEAAERARIMNQLVKRTEQVAYPSVARMWLDWVRTIRPLSD